MRRPSISIPYSDPLPSHQTHMNVLSKVNDTILHHRLQLLLVHSEGGLHLIESVKEVLAADLDLVDIVRDAGEGADLFERRGSASAQRAVERRGRKGKRESSSNAP